MKRRLPCKNCRVSAANISLMDPLALQAAAICSDPNAPAPASTASLAGGAAGPAAQVCSPQVMPATARRLLAWLQATCFALATGWLLWGSSEVRPAAGPSRQSVCATAGWTLDAVPGQLHLTRQGEAVSHVALSHSGAPDSQPAAECMHPLHSSRSCCSVRGWSYR